MTISDWFNRTSMQSFRSFVLSLTAAVVVLWFSGLGGVMLMDNSSAAAALNKDPAIRAAAQTTETSHHNYGMQVVTGILYFLTAAIGVNVVGQGVDRFSAKEHVEAKERGRVSGMAAAVVAAQVVQDARGINGAVTSERPAVAVPAEPIWRPPPPRMENNVDERLPDEPDVWTDDERGEPDPNLPVHLAALGEPHNYNRLREPRLGVMLHYDGSTSDKGAVQWLLRDPRCHVSYNWLVLDNGALVPIAPAGNRAWHAGVCKPSADLAYKDANSAFYGLSLATTVGQPATEDATACVAKHCLTLFRHHGWNPATEGWRIVGHATEAWPRGRKIDPAGPDPSRPVLRVEDIRERVERLATETTV